MRGEFRHTKFVLCEGIEDVAFIRALFAQRAVDLTFDLAATKDLSVNGAGGNSTFGSALAGCEARSGFEAVNRILLIADNDENPTESFAAVCAQLDDVRRLRTVSRPLASPAQAGVEAAGNPAILVGMWPGPDVQGCLETILWGAIQGEHPDRATCVNAAFQCSGANAWSISKRHKAFVRCYFSLYCRENPAATLSTIWNKAATGALMPLSHPSLDAAWAFLSAF